MPLLRKILTIQILVLLLAGCAGAADETTDASALMTQSVGTMVASFFGTQTAMYTPPAPTSTVTQTRFPTPTQITSTFAPTPTGTFLFYSPTLGTPITITGTLGTATVNPASLAVGCNNLAFIRDVNVPAGTVFQANQNFTKTWKVQNTGTCNWMYQYALVLSGGDSFGGKTTKIQKMVAAGNWSELSVQFTAPSKPGTYTSYWRLSSGQSMFGATLVVSFVVGSPSATSAPATATTAPSATSQPSSTSAPTDTPVPSDTPTTEPAP